MNEMRLPRSATLVALAGLIGTMGFLIATSVARSATQTSATLSLRKTTLGMVLVNSRGRTLYLFEKDKGGKSACASSCAKYWPPVVTKTKPTAGPGVKAALVGTTKRSNGALQVTYDKHPLYAFALDTRAGQVSGEGSSNFGAKWYAVSATGAAVKASTSPPPTTTTPGGTTTSTNPYP